MTITITTTSAHHYAFDAVPILNDCLEKLQRTIDQDYQRRHNILYEMKEILIVTERTLHNYLLHILELEQQQRPQSAQAHENNATMNNIMYDDDDGDGDRSPHEPTSSPTNINITSTENNKSQPLPILNGTCNGTRIGVEQKENSYNYYNNHNNIPSQSIMETLEELKKVLEIKQEEELMEHRRKKFLNPQDNTTTTATTINPATPNKHQPHSYYTNATTATAKRHTSTVTTAKSVTDTLLFRLIVALQLCLVRIDDAHFVITGGRRIENHEETTTPTTITATTNRNKRSSTTPIANHHHNFLDQRLFLFTGCCCVMGAGIAVTSFTSSSSSSSSSSPSPSLSLPTSGNQKKTFPRSLSSLSLIPSHLSSLLLFIFRQNDTSSTTHNGSHQQQLIIKLALQGGITMTIGKWVHSLWKNLWMRDKIIRSINELQDWLAQWQMIQQPQLSSAGVATVAASHFFQKQSLFSKKRQNRNSYPPEETTITAQQLEDDLMNDHSRRLIEYAMKNGPRSYFWQTQGEIRFLMLKRFMDVYYASVGTAIDQHQTSSWQLPLVTGAAASFYSIIGARQKASQAINTASRDLIQHAWGMVSLPAIKNLMLQASRLLKGASVADRVEICGVSCFILSRDPAPELAAAIKRQDKQRKALISTLSTIAESEEHEHEEPKLPKKFAGLSGRYRQRDVIFHLTGGGFFAHTIASDLPYLLDWSASTNAVVICPEYALLPEHTFPVALEQIAEVYSALIDGDAVIDLGFEVNRIVVTGESAGGNLAAALCVKLGLQRLEKDCLDMKECADSFDAMSTDTVGEEPTRLPDAIMLSCAALNLSLEITHSRVLGTQDPVLPSGLISAISDAYLPSGLTTKKNPLASPYYAPDPVLRLFPPVLMFAGSNDPLLDDSVTFNERLRCLGVDSELRVAHNMPHAYWGLGTAGFPEAQQVQQECQEWLARQLDHRQ